MKAKRGDLVVITRHHTDYFIGQGTREYELSKLGIVARITRDGLVKYVRVPFSQEDDDPREQIVDTTRERCLIVSQSDIDVSAVMAAYKERGWNGTSQIRPFDSVADARAFVRPFLHSSAREQVA